MNFYETDINTMTFVPEQHEQVKNLINYLLDQNFTDKHSFNEIRVTSDGFCHIVNWINHSDSDFGEEGEFVHMFPDEIEEFEAWKEASNDLDDSNDTDDCEEKENEEEY